MSAPPKPHRHAKEAGFSLIELIVAFALMALVLTTVLAVSARAYRQIGWSGSAAEAAQWAQSLSDEAEGRGLALGREHGSVQGGRYQWSREVAEYADPEGLLVDANGRARLWQTTLEVQWDDGGRAQSVRMVGLVNPPPTASGPVPGGDAAGDGGAPK